ncbi:multiheme c-type cytochrome [Planctomicrobium sp. SH668]|uniref:multiheme c-type cytochrome n=1 Tax=Planctomicrobium sp. SH668 TaxID=3448126 RepID=UPI003F5C18F3
MPSSSTQKFNPKTKVALAMVFVWMICIVTACNPKPAKEAADETDKTETSAAIETGRYGTGGAASDTQPAEVLQDWQTPLAALIFTGDVHGYLEPCGCAENQSGGFARRGGLIKLLTEEKKWPTTAFEVGGSLNETRVTYPQTLIKFAIMLKGLNTLGYQAQGLGKEELLLGASNLFTQFTQTEGLADFHVPFIGTSTTIFGSDDLGTPLKSKIVDVGGVKVGVLSIVGNQARKELEAVGVTRQAEELLVKDARDVLPAAIEALQAQQPNVTVLLSASTLEESIELAKEFPAFNIVATIGTVEDPKSESMYIGNTLLVQVGKKGKNAAIVGLYPENKMKYEVLSLDQSRFKDAPAMRDLMQDYQDRLKAAWPELTAQKISDPQSGAFVGAQECKSCHSYAYNVWSQTKHAHALESLEKGHPGTENTWVNRLWDPECLTCHTTGWDAQKALRFDSGFIDLEQTPHLAGQQCENCHGSGGEHVKLEKAWARGTAVTDEMKAGRDAMKLTLSKAKNDVCGKCHDGDNSPHFDFEKYWPKVNHSGRKD